jgi:aminoglycoside phosphotransferase (APT) family kinase protein
VVTARLHPSLQILSDESLVSHEDVTEGHLKVEDLSRSHVVTRVTPPASAALVVKRARESNLAIGRTLRSELFVYRLAGWVEGLAAVVPRPVMIDEGRQVLVLESDGNAVSLGEHLWAHPDELPWAARALAEAMAGWHRDTLELALPAPPPPFALELERRTDTALTVLGEQARTLARELLADPDVRAALRAALAGWSSECLIHGDVKWDNCLVDGASSEARRLQVVDWELAGGGDRAWDVGCAVAEHYVAATLSGSPIDGAVELLLRAYCSAAGLTRAERDALPARLATATAARLVQCAVEHQDADAGAGRPARGAPLAELARELAAEPSWLAEQWRRAIG